MSFGGHDDALALRGVLEHVEWQEAKTLAFIILSQAGFNGDLDPRFCPGERRRSVDVCIPEAVSEGVA